MQHNFDPAQSGQGDHERLTPQLRARAAAQPDIVIGLVNIMPPSAIRTTERLFRRLLNVSGPQHDIQLLLFAPDAMVERANDGSITGQSYQGLSHLWKSDHGGRTIDALIVTGTEPQTTLMRDEPVWPDLQKLCDWAGDNTISTIWSCFSAHAAVLHIDGIRRRRLHEKRSGVFQCRKAAEHFLAKTVPAEFFMPHSRYNDLAETALCAKDYQILSHGPRIGVDSFSKRHGNSQFLFLQGHPEYSAHILFSEYCRDVKRFSEKSTTDFPNQPENYFDQTTVKALAELRKYAVPSQGNLFPPEFVRAVMAKLAHSWREPAEQLAAAWLEHIAEQKNANWNPYSASKNEAEAA